MAITLRVCGYRYRKVLQDRHILLLRRVGPLSEKRLTEGPTGNPEGPFHFVSCPLS